MLMVVLIVATSFSFAIQLKAEARKEKFGNQRTVTTNFAYKEDEGKHMMLGKYDSDQIKNANFVHNADHQMPQLRRILKNFDATAAGGAPPSRSKPSGPAGSPGRSTDTLQGTP